MLTFYKSAGMYVGAPLGLLYALYFCLLVVHSGNGAAFSLYTVIWIQMNFYRVQ